MRINMKNMNAAYQLLPIYFSYLLIILVVFNKIFDAYETPHFLQL